MGKARQGKIVISNGSDKVEFGMSNSIYPFKAKMWRGGMGHGGVGWMPRSFKWDYIIGETHHGKGV